MPTKKHQQMQGGSLPSRTIPALYNQLLQYFKSSPKFSNQPKDMAVVEREKRRTKYKWEKRRTKYNWEKRTVKQTKPNDY